MLLEVTSPFLEAGLFEISLCESSNKTLLSSIASSNTETNGGKAATIPASSLEKSKANGIELITCMVESLFNH